MEKEAYGGYHILESIDRGNILEAEIIFGKIETNLSSMGRD